MQHVPQMSHTHIQSVPKPGKQGRAGRSQPPAAQGKARETESSNRAGIAKGLRHTPKLLATTFDASKGSMGLSRASRTNFQPQWMQQVGNAKQETLPMSR